LNQKELAMDYYLYWGPVVTAPAQLIPIGWTCTSGADIRLAHALAEIEQA
jgi:hypothetical protein